MKYTNREISSLRDAKYYLALRKASPDAEVLDELVRVLPVRAEEVSEFTMAPALKAGGDVHVELISASTVISPAISRAISRFHNRLYAERKATASSSPTVSCETIPFALM